MNDWLERLLTLVESKVHGKVEGDNQTTKNTTKKGVVRKNAPGAPVGGKQRNAAERVIFSRSDLSAVQECARMLKQELGAREMEIEELNATVAEMSQEVLALRNLMARAGAAVSTQPAVGQSGASEFEATAYLEEISAPRQRNIRDKEAPGNRARNSGKKRKKIPAPKGTLLQVAIAYLERNDLLAALRVLDEVIAKDPMCVEALLKRARVRLVLENVFGSIDDYSRVIDAGYASAEAYTGRSRAYDKLGDEQQSLKDRKQAKYIHLQAMSRLEL